MCNQGRFATSPAEKPNLMGVTIVKKISYFVPGVLMLLVFGSALSGALEVHNVVAEHIEHFNSFHESGSLIVLGSLLITGATFLRRRRAARTR